MSTTNNCPHCPNERPMSKKWKKERNKTCGSKECLSKHLTITSQGNSKNWKSIKFGKTSK